MITKNKCTGCGACAAVCPQNCIEMRPDALEQMVPVINRKQCISCGLCEVTCPQNHVPTLSEPMDCYVAWSDSPEDLVHSASGGVGVMFARNWISRGGVAYGCDYDSQGELRHFRLDGAEMLSRIRGSKYSRSDISRCYAEIKEFLKKGVQVLFVGTPCQVAGLRKYLKKEYDQLVTVDLVCHGTPPNMYLQRHLKEQGIRFPVDKISFRGEFDQKLTVWQEGRIVYQKDWKEDTYFQAFYSNMISYDSCYSCQYAQKKRVSDITIGDFWGVGKLERIEHKSNRPSLILVNTPRGRRFFEEIASQLVWESRPVNEGIQGNGRLINAPGKSYDAELFQKMYKSKIVNFGGAVRSCYRLEGFRARIRKLKSLLSAMGGKK